jgi:hypothetical protein
VEANSTGGQGSHRAVAPSDDIYIYIYIYIYMADCCCISPLLTSGLDEGRWLDSRTDRSNPLSFGKRPQYPLN